MASLRHVVPSPDGAGPRSSFADIATGVLLGRDMRGMSSPTREAEQAQVIQLLETAEFSCGELAKALASRGWTLGTGLARGVLADLEDRFHPYAGPGLPGYYIDFLGVKTRTSYMLGCHEFDGQVVGRPSVRQAVAFDVMEWSHTLHAALEAPRRGSLTVMELGAGWGPWIVTAAAAARNLGVSDVRMVGVEADAHHFAFMRQHVADNGFDPDAHTLLEAVVGSGDGTARFPRLARPTYEWGAQASFDDRSEADAGYVNVPCLALGGLVDRIGRIDLVHCDIQGAEEQAIPAAAEALTRHVRRLVVGTHSRSAEGAVLRALAPRGWVLEGEIPAKFVVTDLADRVFVDGVQVWTNPALAPQP